MLVAGTDKFVPSYSKLVSSIGHSLQQTPPLNHSISTKIGFSLDLVSQKFEHLTLKPVIQRFMKVMSLGLTAWLHTKFATLMVILLALGFFQALTIRRFEFGICTLAKDWRNYKSTRTVYCVSLCQLETSQMIVYTREAKTISLYSGT